MPTRAEVQAQLDKATGGGVAHQANYQQVLWDSGKPYWARPDGSRLYIAPAVAANDPDPQLQAWGKANPRQGSSFSNSGQTWNGDTGQYDNGSFFDSSLGALVMGGSAIAAPYAYAALAGMGGGAAPLASTTIGNGFVPAIEGSTGLAAGSASAATAASTAAEAATVAAAGGPLAATTTAAPLAGSIAPASVSSLPAGGSTGILSTIANQAVKQGKDYVTDPSNWFDIAKQTGDLMSANAAGAAQGRVTQAGVNQNQDRNAISLYQALLANNSAQNNFGLNRGQLANQNAATDLSQRNFALTAPQTRATTAVRGDILANAQDATVSGVSPNIPVPTISGGVRPSMFSADTRALGGIMSSQARQQQEKGDTFSPLPALPDWQAPPAAPTLTPSPDATGMDNALSNTGNILNYAGSFADLLKKYQGGKKPAGTSSTMTNDQALSSGTGQWA